MKIIPKAGPASPTMPSSQPIGQNSRQRALQAFQNAQSPVPLDPNNIGAESLSAVKAPSKGLAEAVEEGQKDKDEQLTSSDAVTPAEAKVEGDEEEGEKKVEAAPVENEAPLSSQFATLARKEKALRAKVQAQEQAIKARETALSQREEAIKAKEAEYQTNYVPKDRLSKDTWGVLSEMGISYDKAIEQALTQSQMDPATKAAFDRMEARLEAQAKAVEESNQRYQDEQKRQYDNAVQQIQVKVDKLVYTDPAYEMIKLNNAAKDVTRLIEKTYKEDKILMTEAEAATAIEEYLVDKYSKIATSSKKLQEKFMPRTPKSEASPAPKSAEAASQQQQPSPMKTLTNSTSTSRKLSARERALLAFRNEKY